MTIKHRASRPEKLMRLASRLLSVLLLSAAPLALADDAGSDQTRIEFNIPVQTVPTALSEFARQARVQLFFISDGYEDVRANALFGTYTRQEALDLLLDGTGLKASISPDSGIEVKPVLSTMSLWSGESRLFAAVREVAVADGAGGSRDPGGLQAGRGRESDDVARERRPIEEIVVTGTNIRGIAPDSSPTRTFTREDIQMTGAGTAQDFIQTLTSNFDGGSNPNIPAGLPDSGAAANAGPRGSFGSSVNLRGLGSAATLVLLNGHRLAPASAIGDFTDISMIPASAIERVDVLTDGASSIYGSDAVAGVVNFILRDDFDGVETALRFGTGTEDGTPDQYRASVTGGKNWDSGHALIVYEFFDQDQLSVEDRSFAQQNVLPNFLLPSQNRRSILASAAQDVAQNLELFADFTYSDRNTRQVRTELFNPDRTYEMNVSSDSMAIAAGGAWNVWDDWVFDFSGTYSDLDTRNLTIAPFFVARPELLSVTDSSIGTADVKLSGTLWRVPGGDIKLALGGHYRAESFRLTQEVLNVSEGGERDIYAAFGEAFIPIIGKENNVLGIERLEINASGRIEHFSDFGTTANPKIGVLWSLVDGLNFRGSYSTSFKAPPLGRVGANNLAAALRSTSEDNATFGLTPADPSIADVVYLLVTGTAKNLRPETSRAFTAGMDFNQQWGAHSLGFSTTWFDINFEDRIGTAPIPENRFFLDAPNIAFNNPDAFPEGAVIFFPTQDEIDDIINVLDRPLFDQGHDLSDVKIINRVLVSRNLSRTAVRGLDIDLSYTYALNNGSLLFGIDGTFLKDFQRQAAPTSPIVDQVNTLFNPVDLKLRGRAGYSNDNFSANAFVNFVDKYRVDNTANAAPIDSWTTVDVNLSYDTKDRLGDSFFNDTVFRLSVINLFDNDPSKVPITATLRADGFDPANASPLGRFIAFEISKGY